MTAREELNAKLRKVQLPGIDSELVAFDELQGIAKHLAKYYKCVVTTRPVGAHWEIRVGSECWEVPVYAPFEEERRKQEEWEQWCKEQRRKEQAEWDAKKRMCMDSLSRFDERVKYYRSLSKEKLINLWNNRWELDIAPGDLEPLRSATRSAMGIGHAHRRSVQICSRCHMVGENCTCG